MKFKVLDNVKQIDPTIAEAFYLILDNWDDWFMYSTTFTLAVVDTAGEIETIGSVKIGQRGLLPSGENDYPDNAIVRRPNLAIEFDNLGDDYFSLATDENYYESLNQLREELKVEVLTSLRDCAFNLDYYEEFKNEQVMIKSLMRGIDEDNVRGRFHRLAKGNAILTAYNFSYSYSLHPQSTIKLDYSVSPNSFPPSNVHVLIGRNGVGKTTFLSSMINTLVSVDQNKIKGLLEFPFGDKFSGLVSISFSAFDDFEPPSVNDRREGISYHYVGLKKQGDVERLPKSIDDLANDFYKSLKKCRLGLRKYRWAQALASLESDPLFSSAGISTWCLDDSYDSKVLKIFKNLSSGHKIVLLTIAKLVEFVDEKTLVLLDEPEAHLHPPLLSALIRSLSDLLFQRNGVAIIATHSPVVLQEVPRSCVSIMHRSGVYTSIQRPQIETFGENLGVLTREVFGLEVTKSGFHKLIDSKISDGDSAEKIITDSNNQLGSEAQALASVLDLNRVGTP